MPGLLVARAMGVDDFFDPSYLIGNRRFLHLHPRTHYQTEPRPFQLRPHNHTRPDSGLPTYSAANYASH